MVRSVSFDCGFSACGFRIHSLLKKRDLCVDGWGEIGIRLTGKEPIPKGWIFDLNKSWLNFNLRSQSRILSLVENNDWWGDIIICALVLENCISYTMTWPYSANYRAGRAPEDA
jgi:hypothetical protein